MIFNEKTTVIYDMFCKACLLCFKIDLSQREKITYCPVCGSDYITKADTFGIRAEYE